jgi:hypothetical protein
LRTVIIFVFTQYLELIDIDIIFSTGRKGKGGDRALWKAVDIDPLTDSPTYAPTFD